MFWRSRDSSATVGASRSFIALLTLSAGLFFEPDDCFGGFGAPLGAFGAFPVFGIATGGFGAFEDIGASTADSEAFDGSAGTPGTAETEAVLKSIDLLTFCPPIAESPLIFTWISGLPLVELKSTRTGTGTGIP